jgi:hypothetical protein
MNVHENARQTHPAIAEIGGDQLHVVVDDASRLVY